MHKPFASLILATAASLLLIGTHVGISDDCTFVGIVRAPTASFDCTQGSDYDVLMRYMATTACNDFTDAGWSIASYRYDPPSVLCQIRYNYDLASRLYDQWPQCNPTGTYTTEFCNAVTGSNIAATLVIGHARNVSNAHPLWYHADAPDPHPFIYEPLDNPPPYYYRLFGKPYSFLHNGGLQVVRISGQPTGLADRTAVGFCALDIFNHREWAVWYHPGGEDKPNDTEHYAMMIMKYLMVQENYYWDGPSNTPPTGVSSMEEWAIRKVVQDTHR